MKKTNTGNQFLNLENIIMQKWFWKQLKCYTFWQLKVNMKITQAYLSTQTENTSTCTGQVAGNTTQSWNRLLPVGDDIVLNTLEYCFFMWN